jgi:hypothetical protein
MIEAGFNNGLAKCVRGFLFVAIVSCLAGGYASGQQDSETPLTNAAVVKLVKAGFKEKTIISIITTRPNRFNLATDQLIQLKHSGVSENVILAMLSLRGYQPDDESWADDAFFRQSAKQPAEDPTATPDSGTGIFGSSNGSKSQSRSRGERGGNETEGNVMGSATVRIIRPPSEAGGAQAKLERTPTLTNEGVIRLVEAGFSEGTIIKRIEDSPVDFDLSTDKVAELHRRRVSDSIIAAMSTAMSDGPTKPQSQPERN